MIRVLSSRWSGCQALSVNFWSFPVSGFNGRPGRHWVRQARGVVRAARVQADEEEAACAAWAEVAQEVMCSLA